jgi:hypothetical protein
MLVRVSESSTTAADATAAFSKVRNAFPLSRSPTCFTDWCVAIASRPCGDGRRGLLRGRGGIRGADGDIAAQAWRRSTSARLSSRWARCARRCRWTRLERQDGRQVEPDQRRGGGWAATCRPGPRITCWRPPSLFALHQMASGGEVGFVLGGDREFVDQLPMGLRGGPLRCAGGGRDDSTRTPQRGVRPPTRSSLAGSSQAHAI